MVETLILGLFDAVICAGLLWLSWRLLRTEELFLAVVLFISFGLFMALTWVRLKAPDLALAEAAIGAGVTGVLLLAALGRLQSAASTKISQSRKSLVTVSALGGFMAVILFYAVALSPEPPDTIKRKVMENMADSGVANPVTAVLLNFRGYDTLLEVLVLFTTAMGVWSLGRALPSTDNPPDKMLSAATRLVIPLMIVVAVYLLWIGDKSPGGAFQGGAVLAAAGLLWLLLGQRNVSLPGRLWARLILLLGPLVFAVSTVLMMFLESHLLEYPDNAVSIWILVIESAALISIAATLITLFLGGHFPATQKNQNEETQSHE